ncbi:MAG: hypothetical protein Aurels2KO_48180 [Aureliella sp.]
MKEPELGTEQATAESAYRNATVGEATFCAVSCLSEADDTTVLENVANILSKIGKVESVALSTANRKLPSTRSVVVAEGTKLAKIRSYVRSLDTNFVCICDPDLVVFPDGATSVAKKAVKESSDVTFGVIDCQDDGTVLSRIITCDKWLSHSVLRPLLWRFGVGITLPGQFVIVSTALLKSIDQDVDSYLDDLYLGLFARMRKAKVLRMSIAIGEEQSRSSWFSLLTQRLRWMQGFASICRHHKASPVAIAFLAAHFAAYHLIPVAWLVCFGAIAAVNGAAACLLLFVLCLVIARAARQPMLVAFAFLMVFPFVHLAAITFWWIPISKRQLTRR